MPGFPVLMYHNVCESDSESTGLTISLNKLEEQLRYLYNKGFTSYHLSELEGKQSLPNKGIVITFDDVTENQLLAIPLLEKYGFKATFFIPFYYIGKTDSWNTPGTERIMTARQLQDLNPAIIELGYHSYLHRAFTTLTEDDINKDFQDSKQVIDYLGLTVYPAIAYPYGNYPKKEPAMKNFKNLLESNGIKMGLRIGNRLNKSSFKNNFQIYRLDIKGHESLFKFRLKLRLGKLKLF